MIELPYDIRVIVVNEYIEQYFNLLVNSDDISVVEELLPSIMLDKTNQIIEILISKLNEEIEVAEELEDTEYLVHLKKIILLLSARKESIIEEEGIVAAEERAGAKKVLSAAALTYVAALAVALANLLRLIAIANRRK